jgi:hypothetical protein
MPRLHPVFHAQLLESYTLREGFPPPVVELLDDGEQWEVEKIVAQQAYRGLPQFLIKWKDWSNEHNTWLFESNLGNCQELLEEYKATAVSRSPPPKRRRHDAAEQPKTTDPVPVCQRSVAGRKAQRTSLKLECFSHGYSKPITTVHCSLSSISRAIGYLEIKPQNSSSQSRIHLSSELNELLEELVVAQSTPTPNQNHRNQALESGSSSIFR